MVSIKTILLINVVFLCLVIVYYFRTEITGLLPGTASIDLTIAGLEAEVRIYIDQAKYCPNETATIQLEIENTGIYNTTGNLTLDVLRPSAGAPKYSEGWNYVDLSVGEVKTFTNLINFTDQDEMGRHRVNAEFRHGHRIESETSSFLAGQDIGILTVSPPQIEKTIKRGDSATETISVWLRYACENAIVNFSGVPGGTGDWVNFTMNNILLTPDTLNSTVANITVPRLTALGDYNGNIEISAGDQTITIPIIVHVNPRDIEVNVTIRVENRTVCLGESVTANVNITKTEPPDPAYINVTHQILDPDMVIIDNQTEIALVENSVLRNPTFNIPINSELGYYTFLSSVEYLDKTDQTSDVFEVLDCQETQPPSPGGGGGSGGSPAPAMGGPALNYSMSLKLSDNLISSLPGKSKTFLATVNNTGNVDLKNVKLSVKGVPSTWLKIIPNDIDIPYLRSQEILVVLDIPNNVAPGTYDIEVKAVGKVESETKWLKLIVGKTPEELADLLIKEMENRRLIAERGIKTDACMELSEIISVFNEGELSRERGLDDYRSKNYEKAVNWFEHAIESYNKVIDRIDLKIENEIKILEKQKIGIFPILGLREQIGRLEIYYSDRNYEMVCEPILEISRLRRLSMVLWVLLFTLLIALTAAFILIRKKRQRYKRKEIIRRVRSRLGNLKFEGIQKSEETEETL
ncbi:MAG: hypothetical protein GF368_05525 [Candidatus Aenigmarchaeota archaeon]|nr:hypothetical protein [Candidatus Aenigmarchaeota archaeon]